MATIGKSAYFIFMSITIHLHTMDQILYILHTGTLSNLIATAFLSEYWTARGHATVTVHLYYTFKDSFDAIENFDLHVFIGDLLTKAALQNDDKLVVNTLLGTCFIKENFFDI